MLLTIFGLVFIIIISETLLFSSVEAHTFTVTSYCTEANPGQIPIPLNDKALELLSICGPKYGYKTTGLKIKKIGNGKNICAYTIERELEYAFHMTTDDKWHIKCDDYSEFHKVKITAYCNCNSNLPNSLGIMPKPINAKAKAIYNVCNANDEIEQEIRVYENNEKVEKDRKYICTYTFEHVPLVVVDCENYSEIEELKKEMDKQNAKMREASEMEENAIIEGGTNAIMGTEIEQNAIIEGRSENQILSEEEAESNKGKNAKVGSKNDKERKKKGAAQRGIAKVKGWVNGRREE